VREGKAWRRCWPQGLESVRGGVISRLGLEAVAAAEGNGTGS